MKTKGHTSYRIFSGKKGNDFYHLGRLLNISGFELREA